ncbi:MAG: methyltransferase domain-containing protein [Cocleimonas sp.]|nr:methyltransferase domain-containing protein [Cocleimonas sp.]
MSITKASTTKAPLKKWNEAYKNADIASAKPAQVLSENAHLLPSSLPQNCNALDLACGRAGNAIFLAKQGFNVDAVDISPNVLESLDSFVKQQSLSISCECRDIESKGLSDKKYDVIVVSYFLSRELFPQITHALKPSGLLFYETWSEEKVDSSGPNNPTFRLQAGELLNLSNTLRPIFYREEGDLGESSKGTRNIAMLVAKNV